MSTITVRKKSNPGLFRQLEFLMLAVVKEPEMVYNLDLDMKHRNRPVWRSRKSATELLETLQDVLQQTQQQ